MAVDIVIPEAGESVTEGVIATWLKKDGEWVERDETIVEVETDKITQELVAPASGLLKTLASEGDTVAIKQKIGEVDESAKKPSGESGEKREAAPEAKPEPIASQKSGPKAESKAVEKPEPARSQSVKVEAKPQSQPSQRGEIRATPLAEKIAQQFTIDLASVTPTGAAGRIREQDVLAFLQARENGGVAPAQAGSPALAGSRESRVDRMSPMRQRIAARLVEAQHTAAMLTTFNECDMTAVMELRKRYKEQFAKKHEIGLGFMSFFVKAACSALRAFPAVNSSITELDGKPATKSHDYCDVAVAVSTPKGLVVPVLRNAETMTFAQIELAIKDLATRAQAGKLDLSEMEGGTFTITNGGVFGSLMSTPILNPPQSGILGMHSIKNRAVEHPSKPGEIAIRPMMYLALSYDHRLVDGSGAVQFLVHVKECIEDPERMLLDL